MEATSGCVVRERHGKPVADVSKRFDSAIRKNLTHDVGAPDSIKADDSTSQYDRDRGGKSDAPPRNR